MVAIEDSYGAYRQVIAAGLRLVRPCVEVAASGLDAIDEELARFEPQVVICTLSPTSGSGERLAWVELSVDPRRPTTIHVGNRQLRTTNPTFSELLEVVDEAERILHERNVLDDG